MITVELQGAEFFAHHGYYPEEQLLGCRFLIDLAVTFDPNEPLAHDDLAGTVNYERLHHICCTEMKKTRKLIETVADAIITEVKLAYPYVQAIELRLRKVHPPLSGNVAASAVVIKYSKP